ncbi:5'-nucleotidase C-terminal domain-containing protein [Yoonia sp. 208BN28-4]|uniref:5'-nucleotidase C-terminal domain-containing protein n=1 Tax=Yoonia sp. 208BN28-4 TaxID=3126505 RepID=UPI0030B5B788
MTRRSAPPTATLRILQTTDLHMALLPYDYATDTERAGGSLAELAPIISKQRADADASLLFDTGDFLQGNPLADLVSRQGPMPKAHPMISAMNMLAYDAVALGNHEFDYGLIPLMRALDDLSCPALLANVTTEDGASFFQASAMVARQVTASDGMGYPLRIGVIGLLTPSTLLTPDEDDPAQLQVHAMTTAAKTAATALRADGADIVVALCHAGIARDTHFETASDVAALPDIDVVLGGHVHKRFPDADDAPTVTVAGKPALMAGAFGQHLGQLDLHLARTDDSWQIKSHAATLIPAQASSQAADKNIVKLAAPAHARTLDHIRQPIAAAAVPIHSFFARVAPDRSLQLLSDVIKSAMQTALPDPKDELPFLTAVAPFSTGANGNAGQFVNIPVGRITMRTARALYPFDNKLVIARQSGSEILARLEKSAEQFCTVAPHVQDQVLLNPNVPAYNSDTIFGLTYRIDLTKSAGHGRVHHVRYNGRPVNGNDQFLIGMSTHRAMGGGGYARVRDEQIVYQSPYAIFAHLLAYLRHQQSISPPMKPVWQFDPIADASAVFRTSAAAPAHLTTAGSKITQTAGHDDGFATYRLTFAG